MRKTLVALGSLLLLFPLLLAADPAPATASRFLRWLDDDHWLASSNGQFVQVEALSGRETPFAGNVDAVHPTDADPGVAFGPLGPSPAALVNERVTAKDLTIGSPDGKWSAVNRKNDLYFVEKATKAERRLTRDGSDVIFNGRADAVYQEEIFFPARKLDAVWWSPDSMHLAFMRLDDTDVGKFTIIDHTVRVGQKPEVTTYPKAGTTNPTVKIGIAHVNDGTVTWVDLGAYDPRDLLISRVGWTPDSKEVYFYAQNRIQTWLDLGMASCETGKPRKLFRDSNQAWVRDLGAIGPVNFLKDGTFLFFSERTGNKHLYHYAADGQLKNAVTSGDWDALKLNKVDEDAGIVYFNSNKDAWLGSVPHKVRLDGAGLESLTRADGTHDLHFSPGGKYFVDERSDYDTPPQFVLHRVDGTPVRTIEEPQKQPKKQGKAELVKITTPDGVHLAATLQFPPNMDKNKKYPVWLSFYGGPHMPMIRNAFGGGFGDQGKTNQGYIVFHVDPRSSSTTPKLAWTCYKQLGVQETKDLESAAQWLIDTYPTVDPKRIGISGHSYGGYLTAYAMTHSTMFAAGIAGAPPTDWRNYNTIYTERYMTLPEQNPKGYEASSVLDGAKNLHGRLLIAHGMMDDNVHMTSSIQLADALQKANRDFEIMLYPLARHGLGGSHYQRFQNEFMKRALQP